MYKFLQNLKYPGLLLIVGGLFVFVGFFEIKDITKYQVVARSEQIYPIAISGWILLSISTVAYFFDKLTLGWLGFRKINKLKTGFGTKILNTEINILFGRLEKISDELTDSMVVLPANEFFDDECINDKRSALGAYVSHKFTNQAEKIEELVVKELHGYESWEVEKEEGVKQNSFGVGTGVLLKKPMESKQAVLFLSVTTKRAGEGLRAEMSYIFQALRKVQSIGADNRIDSICIPVMGSGHGGLRKEVALFGLLLAICNGVTKPYGHHIRQFNVVVFQSSDSAHPSISKSVAKRLLRISTGMFS